MIEYLKEQQPHAYQLLYNAIYKNRLAHAYIFVGPKEARKKESAYLLAQSLVCKQEGFACGVCDACLRIQHNNFADMRYMDGNAKTIKKEDILDLKEEFSKTKVEREGSKIYILDGAAQATPQALHALLTFLEEPSSDVIAILLVENMERILDTIQSRCQIVPFVQVNNTLAYELLKSEYTVLDAYLLSRLEIESKDIKSVQESDEFQHTVYIFKNYIDKLMSHSGDIQVFIQYEAFYKSKMDQKLIVRYFMTLLYIFAKDCIMRKEVEDTWYQKNIDHYESKEATRLLKVSSETIDKITKSVNVGLLVDEFLYRMEDSNEYI